MTALGMLPSGMPYLPPTDPLALVHVDHDVIAVDKPSGLLSVPGKAAGLSDCLEHRVRDAYPRSLLLHRLDMDTSGIMLFAHNRDAQRHIARQFNKGTIGKIYQALVWGHPAEDHGRIDAPLVCDWPRRPLQKVCTQTGKASVTEWRVIETAGPLARLELKPLTGRSHQLRVHLRHMGHPIAGDRFYASGAALQAAPRLALHAKSIRLRHPDGGAWVEYASDVPF